MENKNRIFCILTRIKQISDLGNSRIRGCDWSINNEKGSKIGFLFILSLYSKPTKGRLVLIRLKYLSLENKAPEETLVLVPVYSE